MLYFDRTKAQIETVTDTQRTKHEAEPKKSDSAPAGQEQLNLRRSVSDSILVWVCLRVCVPVGVISVN